MDSHWISNVAKDDLASVIIPVYNREELVTEALDSVFEQTYRPIEVVVVDDGSEDQTAEAIAAWSKSVSEDEDFSVRYIYQENAGAPAARNHGSSVSQGAYIQYLDSDDLLLPEKIERGVHLIEENNVDMVYSRTVTTDMKGRRTGHCGVPFSGEPANIPSYSWHISGPLYKRSMLQSVGPWLEALTGSQDWEYCARVKLGDFDIHFDQDVGSVYRSHQDEVRVSRTSMEYDYTRSTERAYDHIYQLAVERGVKTPAFASRMGRLYFYRALEYRNNGYERDAMRCIQKIRTCTHASDPIWGVATLCHYITHPLLTKAIQRLVDWRNQLAV